MGTNNFLPFCNTDTGTNLPTQGAYAVDPNRDIGNSPGIASSKLNNKPIRQATAIASQVAQFLTDNIGDNILDDGNMANLLASMQKAWRGGNYNPQTTTYAVTAFDNYVALSGSTFTATLPAITSVPIGKIYTLVKTSNDLVAYTVAANGSDTIGGAASTSLNTYMESIDVVKPNTGTNWVILRRIIPSIMTSYTPSFQGFGTATNIDFYWWRTGCMLNVSGVWTNGTVSSSEARVGLPGSLATPVFSRSRNVGQFERIASQAGNFGGPLIMTQAGANYLQFSAPNIYSNVSGSWSTITPVAGNSSNSSQDMSCEFKVPIAGWSA